MTILEALRATTESIKTWVESKFINKEEGTPKITHITILEDAWTSSDGLYSQPVLCSGMTYNSKLDLQPTPEQFVTLQENEIALMAVNDNGRAIVYALNNKTQDMVIQVEITEVTVV